MTAESTTPRTRREYLRAIILIGVGSGALWWGMSRTWIRAQEPLLPGADIEGATATVGVSGTQVAPLALAAAIIGLAGIAGIVGSSGVVRRVIGALVGVAGLAALASVAQYLIGGDWQAAVPGSMEAIEADSVFAWVALVGAVVMTAGSALVVWRGQTWPGLGRSYERGSSRQPKDAWESLDRGIDPTVDDHNQPS